LKSFIFCNKIESITIKDIDAIMHRNIKNYDTLIQTALSDHLKKYKNVNRTSDSADSADNLIEIHVNHEIMISVHIHTDNPKFYYHNKYLELDVKKIKQHCSYKTPEGISGSTTPLTSDALARMESRNSLTGTSGSVVGSETLENLIGSGSSNGSNGSNGSISGLSTPSESINSVASVSRLSSEISHTPEQDFNEDLHKQFNMTTSNITEFYFFNFEDLESYIVQSLNVGKDPDENLDTNSGDHSESAFLASAAIIKESFE
jgi:hypothetical protein